MKQNNYYMTIKPVSKVPKYLRKFKGRIDDSILDSSVIFYYMGDKVIFSKHIFNVFNIPENILFPADFFDIEVQKELLANFPVKKFGNVRKKF